MSARIVRANQLGAADGTPGRSPREAAPAGVSVDHAADELLWRYARTRDIRLRNQIFAIHERLAHFVASRFGRPGTDAMEDLTQVARVGLIAAIERYDPA